MNIEPVEIDALINDAVEIVTPLISQRQQVLNVDVEMPSPIVEMDRQRIEQVILNLLSNAQKYTEDNAPIEINATRQDGSVLIRVTGYGPDIPAEDKPHLFEPFFHGSGQAARRSPGRGLGLAIARAFVELHDGEIGFESIPAIGPSLYFTLPLTGNRKS